MAGNDTGPSEEEIAARRDDGYRAVGRYIVVFSQMLQEMRSLRTFRLQDTTARHTRDQGKCGKPGNPRQR